MEHGIVRFSVLTFVRMARAWRYLVLPVKHPMAVFVVRIYSIQMLSKIDHRLVTIHVLEVTQIAERAVHRVVSISTWIILIAVYAVLCV